MALFSRAVAYGEIIQTIDTAAKQPPFRDELSAREGLLLKHKNCAPSA
jgi:hypothetical protein